MPHEALRTQHSAPWVPVDFPSLASGVEFITLEPGHTRPRRRPGIPPARFDIEERLWPRASDPARVAIIDIDEKSLAQYGQWPWSRTRTRVAELVRRIAEGHPCVLGIDIVFAEPDRLSPPEIARELPGPPAPLVQELAQLPPSERELIEAMRTVPTVLAMSPAREDTAPYLRPVRPAPIRQAGGDASRFSMNYNSLLRSLPELEAWIQGTGA